ncbi:MAG: hypothetical protein IPM56_15950 [Ignavibacteriales bacterium]|nr:MAG: hypothetical protein IPM56_15950 [Ignavibacteriales bacterium]
MQEINLFALYTEVLTKNNIEYFITGSVASIVYGDPRLTHDIDLVVNLSISQVGDFVKAFPSKEFYCPPQDVIITELNRYSRGHFNLIHLETGFKADIYFTGKEELQHWAMQNRKQIEFAGSMIFVAPPEYVIIKKLEFFREGNAQKHLSDIKSILNNSSELINFDFLSEHIDAAGLRSEWEAAEKF